MTNLLKLINFNLNLEYYPLFLWIYLDYFNNFKYLTVQQYYKIQSIWKHFNLKFLNNYLLFLKAITIPYFLIPKIPTIMIPIKIFMLKYSNYSKPYKNYQNHIN